MTASQRLKKRTRRVQAYPLRCAPWPHGTGLSLPRDRSRTGGSQPGTQSLGIAVLPALAMEAGLWRGTTLVIEESGLSQCTANVAADFIGHINGENQCECGGCLRAS